MSDFPIAAGLQKTAHALRPMRIDRDESPVHYEATTFPRGAYQGCELQIRRMECFGMLTKRDGPLQGTWFLDVLDADGDILDTLEVNARGVKYMRRTLFMKRKDTALRDAFDNLAARIPSVFDGDCPLLTFYSGNGEARGKLWRRGGVLSFEGNAEDSAKVFFENVIQLNREWLMRSNDRVKRGDPVLRGDSA